MQFFFKQSSFYCVHNFVLQDCSKIDNFQPRNLTFPGGKIGLKSNVTWGFNEFGHFINCIDKFVLLYEWSNGSGVLCPSFNVTKLGENDFQCSLNLTQDFCNQSITVNFEAWTFDKKMLRNGPYGQVFINCSIQNVQKPQISG